MKLQKTTTQFSCFFVILCFLSSCVPDKTTPETDLPDAPPAPIEHVEKQNQLPVRYQKPTYMVDTRTSESLDEIVADVTMKVGASIRSTQGPQPLWDILKRLAALKKMSVSWASDVDQNVLVDVDINANDDFYVAIKNLLRQVDYYHEMQGSTIVVKYKETRQYHIAMPFTKQLYETATGGNVLGSNDAASNIEGTIRLDSKGNEFDIWKNIELNMKAILDVWTTKAGTTSGTTTALNNSGVVVGSDAAGTSEERANMELSATRMVSSDGNLYTIDKPVGLITVHAPRQLHEKLKIYFENLKHELYKQVSIEAKIIEVQLSDHSSIGLNWNLLLKNLSVSGGQYQYGSDRSRSSNSADSNSFSTARNTSNSSQWDNNSGQTGARSNSTSFNAATGVWEGTSSEENGNTLSDTFAGSVSDIATTAATSALSSGSSLATVLSSVGGAAISMAAFSFDSFINAVKEQGQTTILSNPKLSVLNGQPALITVGRNVTYIDSIESDISRDTGTVSYTVNTERVLSGVGLALTANILDDNEVILSLVPVTSELQEPIEYRNIGAGEVGLPVINVREMSTTVKVKDGEMLVIGGLISNVEEEDGTFLPGTSGIPFFKYLFGYEEKTSRKRELIILLKPRIL